MGGSYDKWTGLQMTNGIAQGKNLLGADCLVLGFFFFWHLLKSGEPSRSRERRNELWLIAGFLLGICWILRLAHSATSSIALCLGILTVMFVGMRSINKNSIGIYMSVALILIIAARTGIRNFSAVVRSFGQELPIFRGRTNSGSGS